MTCQPAVNAIYTGLTLLSRARSVRACRRWRPHAFMMVAVDVVVVGYEAKCRDPQLRKPAHLKDCHRVHIATAHGSR